MSQSESADTVHGRLLEAVHISGYSFERACSELDWLLDDGRWELGGRFDSIGDFLATMDLSPFKIDGERRKGLARKLAALEASQRATAKMLGVSVGTVNADLVQNRTPARVAAAEDQPKIADDVQNRTSPAPPPAVTQISGTDAAKLAARHAEKQERAQQAETRRAEIRDTPAPSKGERYRVIHADLADAEIEPGSVDCILTDPPYPKEHLGTFSVLADRAALWLKDGGSLVVMSGQTHLPAVLARLTANAALNYHWTMAYLTPGGQAVQVFPRKVNTFWKPVLWLVKGVYAGDWFGDVTRSDVNNNDKRFHDWGQSESGIADLMNRVSRPGQLIADPFCGGGTTGVVALATGRRFVGVDTSDEACRISSARLAGIAA